MKWFTIAGLVGLASAQSIDLLPITPPKGTQTSNMPAMGLGTWYMRGANGTRAVSQAIVDGYRFIDNAYIYGNEREIGAGIRDGIKRAGIRREDVWVTSKLWNSAHGNPESALKSTLSALGLTYLDLYIVHFPIGPTGFGDHLTVWKKMETLPATKLTRFVGFSNFNPAQVKEVLGAAKLRPKVVQIELHPYLAQTEFLKSLQAENITVNGYSPLANTNPYYNSRTTKVLAHPTITAIASARGCAPAQVVLKWNMNRGVAVIPKAANVAHQKENYAALEKCKLTPEDEAKITAMSATKQYRYNTQPCAMQGGRCWSGLAKGY